MTSGGFLRKAVGAEKGQIIFHYDYWDVAEFMAEVSAVRPIVNLFKSN